VIVIDSSGWVEFFTNGALANEYATRIRTIGAIVTPTIVLYEVYKRLKRDVSEDDALVAIGAMGRSRVVQLDDELALTAADVSLALGLAMADAIVLATARAFDAELITSDADFARVPGVTFLRRGARGE
jgi:predicted nucleic acid-binding protein